MMRTVRPLTVTVLLVSLLAANPSPGRAQEADDLAITWGVTDNYVGGRSYFESRLTLKSNQYLDDDWAIYFNFIRMIRSDSLDGPLSIRLINGSFYELKPRPAFELPAGDSISVRLIASNWAVRESAAPSGFYFIAGGGAPEPIQDVRIKPFVTPQQVNRARDDMIPVVTAERRFLSQQRVHVLPESDFSPVIPTPLKAVRGEGTINLKSPVVISAGAAERDEAEHLAEMLAEHTGLMSQIVDGDSTADIALMGDATEQQGTACRNAGGYRLSIGGERITILARDPAGLFYGAQTLISLMDPGTPNTNSSAEVPVVTIQDCPRFPYRGLMIDVARHFHPADRIKQTIRIMSFYKLNKLHFHLSDDEGWRLPVRALPELTSVGGRRGHTLDSHDVLPPSFGSGPDPETSPGSGFYTREEFIDLLQYATRHHVEVIPEIDSPGHMRAAIKSMENRYRRLVDAGKSDEATEFLLTDLGDQSIYRSVQGWDDNVLNVCVESTYRFMETVIDELIGLFAQAKAPLTTIHLGGDEVPHGVWEESPACSELLASRNDLNDVHDLSANFFRRIVKYLETKGLKGAGWEEIGLEAREVDGARHEAPKPDLTGKVVPYAWNSVWGWGGEERAYKLANAGYEVVMANVPNLYFDLAAEKHPEEPGFAWGGFVDERKIFEMTPMDMYNSAYEDLWGRPIDREKYADAVRLTPEGARNILGIQGQLWGENTPSMARFEYHLYPKMLALAERAWTAQPKWEMIGDEKQRLALLNEDWNRFANGLGQRESLRLSKLLGGVGYRIPPPGAKIVDGMLFANVAFPGLEVRYSLDRGEPTASSPLWTGPVPVEGAVMLRAFDATGRGGRSVSVSSR